MGTSPQVMMSHQPLGEGRGRDSRDAVELETRCLRYTGPQPGFSYRRMRPHWCQALPNLGELMFTNIPSCGNRYILNESSSCQLEPRPRENVQSWRSSCLVISGRFHLHGTLPTAAHHRDPVAEDKIPVPGWLDHIPSLCCIYQPIGHGCDLSVCVKYNCVCVRVRILLWAPAAGATKGCGNVVGGEEWRQECEGDLGYIRNQKIHRWPLKQALPRDAG